MTNEVVWPLEIVKLVVAALTPIAVAILGWWITRHLKRLEHLQWAGQKVIEKRLQVYSELAPLLNDLYCYFDFIGDWKMKDPVELLAHKRSVDRSFYVNATLFSGRFRKAYAEFMDLCFIPGPLDEYDSTAKLKTDVNTRKEMFAKRREPWNPKWDEYFAPADRITTRGEMVRSYRHMMETFAQDLGVGLKEH